MAIGGVVAWVLAVAVLTLRPGGPSAPVGGFACFPCGEFGSADAVLNVILFTPLGVLLSILGVPAAWTAASGFAFSGLIEATQLVLPGRFPTLADIVANGLGAVVGLGLVRWGPGLVRDTRVVAGSVIALLVLTAVGVDLAPPSGDLFGQHTPQLGRVPAWDGAIVEARVGARTIPPWQMTDPEPVRGTLGETAPLDVRFVQGSAPPVRTPVFAIFSGDQEEALFLGVRGDSLFVRASTRARAARFRHPWVVMPGVLRPTQPGDTVHLRTWTDRLGRCWIVGALAGCQTGLGPAEGWRLLVDATDWPGGIRWWASLLWVAVPAGMVGYSGDRARARRLWGIGLLGFAVVLPAFTALAASGYAQLLIGAVGGWFTGRRVRGGAASPAG